MTGWLYFGLHRRTWGRKYGEREDSIYGLFEQIISPEGANNQGNFKGNDWFVCYGTLPKSYLHARTTGYCLDPKCQFAYETETQENEAVEAIVECLSRFKQIRSELDALAASAQS
jgi:hypothetical protein